MFSSVPAPPDPPRMTTGLPDMVGPGWRQAHRTEQEEAVSQYENSPAPHASAGGLGGGLPRTPFGGLPQRNRGLTRLFKPVSNPFLMQSRISDG